MSLSAIDGANGLLLESDREASDVPICTVQNKCFHVRQQWPTGQSLIFFYMVSEAYRKQSAFPLHPIHAEG
jgi:hypothetical protein